MQVEQLGTLMFSQMRSEGFSFYSGGLGVEACSSLLLCLQEFGARPQWGRFGRMGSVGPAQFVVSIGNHAGILVTTARKR